VSESVAANVAIVGGVGQWANPHAVKNDPEDALKAGHEIPHANFKS
jgi:hypothetical protein